MLLTLVYRRWFLVPWARCCNFTLLGSNIDICGCSVGVFVWNRGRQILCISHTQTGSRWTMKRSLIIIITITMISITTVIIITWASITAVASRRTRKTSHQCVHHRCSKWCSQYVLSLYVSTHGVTHSNEILYGGQTRWEENFYSCRPCPGRGQNFCDTHADTRFVCGS